MANLMIDRAVRARLEDRRFCSGCQRWLPRNEFYDRNGKQRPCVVCCRQRTHLYKRRAKAAA